MLFSRVGPCLAVFVLAVLVLPVGGCGGNPDMTEDEAMLHDEEWRIAFTAGVLCEEVAALAPEEPLQALPDGRKVGAGLYHGITKLGIDAKTRERLLSLKAEFDLLFGQGPLPQRPWLPGKSYPDVMTEDEMQRMAAHQADRRACVDAMRELLAPRRDTLVASFGEEKTREILGEGDWSYDAYLARREEAKRASDGARVDLRDVLGDIAAKKFAAAEKKAAAEQDADGR